MKLSLTLVVMLLASGCGEELVKPKGRAMRDGKPLLSFREARVRITFSPVTGGDGPPDFEYPASVLPQGGFEVKGLKEKGIPPGKYRIAVEILDRNSNDRLQGAFSRPRTPFVSEVRNPPEEIVIDLDKPAG